MDYKFCSICGSRLKKRKDGNLACVRCDFVNYRNARPTVSALVLHGNKLLLTKRAGAPFKGWWDFPGGFVDRGESAESAIKRELWEETGLRSDVPKFFGTYPGTYVFGPDHFHVLNISYLIHSPSGRLLARDDVAESRWFSRKELPKKIAFDSQQKLIKDFLKNLWK